MAGGVLVGDKLGRISGVGALFKGMKAEAEERLILEMIVQVLLLYDSQAKS